MTRPSNRKLILFAAAAVPYLVLAAAWLGRAPLGVWAVTDYLRRQGAPARITINQFNLKGMPDATALDHLAA